jgi:energy-coupling factor transporter ATP-binding protein EcfA2
MNEDIMKWLKSQHVWLQMAASKILPNGVFSDMDISELVQIIKETSGSNPKKLRVGFPETGKVDNKNDIKLLSIGPIEGIDRLNPKKPLVFCPKNLSIVYGPNGSGKSGIVRILKNICGKPNVRPLKSNVYNSVPSKQSCMIKYSINEVENEDAEWIANMQPISELSNVDIFDATNGNIYLENETEATYIPPELTLFTDLVTICEKVATTLDHEQQKLVNLLPKMPDRYLSTSYAEKYKVLRHDISQITIDDITTFTEENEKNLQSLQQRLSTADPVEAARKKRAIKTQIEQIISNIKEKLNAVSFQLISDLRTKHEVSIQKRKAVSEGSQVLASTAKLDGIDSETWRQLWSAARDYSTTIAYKGKTFPNIEEKARCVLCQQELDEEAKSRLKSFEAFVQGELETEAQKAEAEFENAIDNLPSITVESSIVTICQAAELDEAFTVKIKDFFSNANKILECLHAKQIPEDKDVVVPPVDALIDKLSKLSSEAEINAQQYEQDASNFDRNKAQNELLELEAKQWTSQQKEAVEAEIKRLKELEKYHAWKKLTDTGKITREASVVSEKLITEAYIARFNDELKKLGAEMIAVEMEKTRAVKGKSKHRICLKNLVSQRINPVDILSDGEKRIVSLAAFLADVTGYTANTPFIFDDPISSLDQEFEEKTIERLVELSKERQVIVFTHRLSFLSIISDKAKKSGLEQNIIHISKEPWGTGNPGDVPIFGKDTKEALNKLKNERLVQAKKESDSNGSDAYYPLGKAICSDFRIILERVVESVLLSEIVLRYRRDIQTKNKLSNLLKISKEDCDMLDDLMTRYSFFEHSQPRESLVQIPEPEVLESDLNNMIKWHEEFKKRPTISTGDKTNA